MTTLNWFLFGGLIVFGAVWTLRFSRLSKSSQAYFVADKKTSLFALVATLVMTELNTSTLVGFASMGYVFGPSALLLACVFLAGLLFYALTVAKKWKQFDGITVTTFFTERYNPTIGYVAAIILLAAMLGFSANFLKSLTLIFAPLFPGFNPWVVSAAFCALMMLITLRGGLKAIIKIDMFSFLATLVLFPTLIWFSYGRTEPTTIDQWSGPQFPLHMVLSLSIITMFTYILAPWYGQKIFSAKSESTAMKAVFVSAILVSGIYALGILGASIVASDPAASLSGPQDAIPYLIGHYLPLSLQGITYAALFFIAATTLVGLWNTIASVFIAHHIKSVENKPLSRSILLTAIIAFLSYLGANLFVDQILEKLILCNIPIAALSFSLLGGFYWKTVTPTASLVSIATGILGGASCYFYFGDPDYLWYWAVYVIPLHFLVGAGITLFQSERVVTDPSAVS